MSPEGVAKMLDEARAHFHVVIRMYWKQVIAGRRFLHEHPQSAKSWEGLNMVELLGDRRVDVIAGDQCQYGPVTPGADGAHARAKKPTKCASSSPRMPQRLGKGCSGQPDHQHFEGRRAKQAELYPLGLIAEILRSMRRENGRKHKDDDADEDGMLTAATINSSFPATTTSHKRCSRDAHLKKTCDATTSYANSADGTKKKLNVESKFKSIYVDGYHRQELGTNLTREETVNEMDYVNKRGTFVSTAEAKATYPQRQHPGRKRSLVLR